MSVAEANSFDEILDDEYLLAISTMPAALKYTHLIYQSLKRSAKPETVTVPLIGDEIEARVFRGNLGELFKESGASNSYYSEIRRTLVDGGSIHILERGTVHSSSVVVVTDKLPPMSTAERLNVKSPAEVLTTDHPYVKLIEDRVEVIEARLPDLNLTEALRNMETRIAKLEGNPQKIGDSHDTTLPNS